MGGGASSLEAQTCTVGDGRGWEGMGTGNSYCILTVLSYKEYCYFKIYPDLASGSQLRESLLLALGPI